MALGGRTPTLPCTQQDRSIRTSASGQSWRPAAAQDMRVHVARESRVLANTSAPQDLGKVDDHQRHRRLLRQHPAHAATPCDHVSMLHGGGAGVRSGTCQPCRAAQGQSVSGALPSACVPVRRVAACLAHVVLPVPGGPSSSRARGRLDAAASGSFLVALASSSYSCGCRRQHWCYSHGHETPVGECRRLLAAVGSRSQANRLGGALGRQPCSAACIQT